MSIDLETWKIFSSARLVDCHDFHRMLGLWHIPTLVAALLRVRLSDLEPHDLLTLCQLSHARYYSLVHGYWDGHHSWKVPCFEV